MTKISRPTNAKASASKDVAISASTTMFFSDMLNRDERAPCKQPPAEGQGEAIRMLAYQKWKRVGAQKRMEQNSGWMQSKKSKRAVRRTAELDLP